MLIHLFRHVTIDIEPFPWKYGSSSRIAVIASVGGLEFGLVQLNRVCMANHVPQP